MQDSRYSNHATQQVTSLPSLFSLQQGLYTSMQMNPNVTVRTTGLCCHCGRGLPYDRYYFWCLFCDLRLCAECPGSHPTPHQPYFKWLLDRATPRGALPTQKACMKCKRLSHCSLGCEDCQLNLCVDCAATSLDTLANHGHGKLAMLKAPDDYGIGNYSIDCDACRAGGTLSHCGRCCNGIKRGDSFWACVTCVKDYNGQIRFCGDCQSPGQQDHDPTHKFASFQYRVDLNMDPKYNIVRCLECKQTVSFNGQSLARHPHTRFQITMGEAEKDRRIYHNYRACLRKPVRDIATVSNEAHNLLCHCCNQRFPVNSNIFLCPTCTLITCETCAESGGARSHPHIMISVSLIRTAPPDDLWQYLAMPGLYTKPCDKCEKPIMPHSDCYIQCNHCQNWKICLDCTKKRNIPVRHTCAETVEMTLFDPVDRGSEWLAIQVSMAQKSMSDQQLQLQYAGMLPGQSSVLQAGSGVQSPIQLQTAQRQPSVMIKRKPPSSRSSSSSTISSQPVAQPITPSVAQQPSIAQIQAIQTPASFGLTPVNLPLQQNTLPPIQPSIQPVVPPSDIRRKALSPKIENASRVMYDKTSNVSRAAYDKASTMAKEIDTDSMKKVGKSILKGTAKVAGAVGVNILRGEIQQATGVNIPPINTNALLNNNKPNQQQLLTMNAQMQTINKLNAQLQLAQKIAQLQQAQNLATSAQHGGVSAPTGNPMMQIQMANNNAMAYTAPIQGSIAPIPASGATIPPQNPATSIPTSGVNVPLQGTTTPIPPGDSVMPQPNFMAPLPQSEANVSQYGSLAPVPTTQPSSTAAPSILAALSLPGPAVQIPMSEGNASPHGTMAAPIPSSEAIPMQGPMTPALPSEAAAPPPPNLATQISTSEADEHLHGSMAPIPACEAPGFIPNTVSPVLASETIPHLEETMAPIPASEANTSAPSAMAPIPACEATPYDSSFAPIPPCEQAEQGHSQSQNAEISQPAGHQSNVNQSNDPAELQVTVNNHVETNIHVSADQTQSTSQSPPHHENVGTPGGTAETTSPYTTPSPTIPSKPPSSNQMHETGQAHPNGINYEDQQVEHPQNAHSQDTAHSAINNQSTVNGSESQHHETHIEIHSSQSQQSNPQHFQENNYSHVHDQANHTNLHASSTMPTNPSSPTSLPQSPHNTAYQYPNFNTHPSPQSSSSPPPVTDQYNPHPSFAGNQPPVDGSLPTGGESSGYFEGHPQNPYYNNQHGPSNANFPENFTPQNSQSPPPPPPQQQPTFPQPSAPQNSYLNNQQGPPNGNFPGNFTPQNTQLPPPPPPPPQQQSTFSQPSAPNSTYSPIPPPQAAGPSTTPHITIQVPPSNSVDTASQQQIQQQLHQLQQQIQMMNMNQQQNQQQPSSSQQTIDNLQIELLTNQLHQQEQQQTQQNIHTGLSVINSLFGNNSNSNNGGSNINLFQSGSNNDIANIEAQLNAQIAAINGQSNQSNQSNLLEIQQLNDQLAALNCNTQDNNSQLFMGMNDSSSFTENVNLNINMSDTFGGGTTEFDFSDSVTMFSQDDSSVNFC